MAAFFVSGNLYICRMKQLDSVEIDRAKHVKTVNEIWAKKAADKKKLLEEKSTKKRK